MSCASSRYKLDVFVNKADKGIHNQCDQHRLYKVYSYVINSALQHSISKPRICEILKIRHDKSNVGIIAIKKSDDISYTCYMLL